MYSIYYIIQKYNKRARGDPATQQVESLLIVMYANIKGIIVNKASILSELCKDEHCHCICFQDTHRANGRARPNIPGMALVAEPPHNTHRSSVVVT